MQTGRAAQARRTALPFDAPERVAWRRANVLRNPLTAQQRRAAAAREAWRQRYNERRDFARARYVDRTRGSFGLTPAVAAARRVDYERERARSLRDFYAGGGAGSGPFRAEALLGSAHERVAFRAATASAARAGAAADHGGGGAHADNND